MSFDYYYGMEAESFSFYRIPKVLISDPLFKPLSTDAKLLYGLLLNRMSLSVQNGWHDEENRVYIYYTLDEIQEDLNCGHGKAVKLLAELDSIKGIGLIERVRQGLGKPDIIYVKQFIPHTEDNRARPPLPKTGKPDIRKSNAQTSENRTSKVPQNGLPDFRFLDANYIDNNQTDLSQTDKSYTDPSIPPSGRTERLDMMDVVKEQIEYSTLLERFPPGSVESLATLIADVLRSTSESVRIGGSDVPMRLVKERFRQLRSDHIEYVLDSLGKTTSKITNIRAYLLTALYNAPVTIDPFYDAAVRHDFG